MCPVFDLQLFEEGFLLMGMAKMTPTAAKSLPMLKKMYRAFTDYLAFSRVIELANVGELNLAIAHKGGPMLINVAEALTTRKSGA